jgi:RNA polymerase sigma-70 factor (ECF subfamily)
MAANPAVGRADARGDAVARPEVQVTVQTLFERHGERVLAYCRRRLRSREEAEDALQTTFLYACRGLQRGVVPKTEIAWLLKIAHNVCLSTWDSDRRRRRLELVQDPERLEELTPAEPSGHESAIALEDALGDLTDLQRRAILLREWRGLSYNEIAEELNLSHSAVETLLFRARRTLAHSLERRDVERPRTLARCLDFAGLFASLKSALSLGGSAKVAAGFLGAAVLAGSIPDTPERPAPERSQATSLAQISKPPVDLAVGVVDPPTLTEARAGAPKAKRDQRPAEHDQRRRSEKKKKGAQAQPGEAVQLPAVGQTLGETVQGVTDTLNETVDKAVNETLPPVLDLVDDVVGGDSITLP